MEVDAYKGDRGEIFLNGVNVTFLVFYADDEKGIVKGHMRNAQGQLLIDRVNDELLAWVSHGDVKIIVK